MPERTKTLEVLSGVDIFASLKETQLVSLSKIAILEDHKAGRVVFRQGDPSDSFQIVQKGVYDVYLWDEMLQVERPIGVLGSGDIMGEMGVLTGDARSAFVRCRAEGSSVRFDKKPFFHFLEKNPIVTLAIAKTLAYRLNTANRARRIPFENIARFKIDATLINLLPLQVILRHKVLPLEIKEKHVKLGVVDPADLIGRNIAGEFLGSYELEWVCISQPDFEHFRDTVLYDLLEANLTRDSGEDRHISFLTGNTLAASDANSSVAQTLNEIIEQAIEASASDLHFEPGPKGVAVRARIDGHLLEHAAPMDMAQYKHLVSRIKVLSDLDITETRMPQEASVRTQYGHRHIDLRISTLPTPRGESVVIRLLDPEQRKLDLRHLIVNESVADMAEHVFSEPAGLLLVTGPTGSGKTTTLYAGIQMRLQRNPTHKLITAEDPVEYEFNNSTQVQVNESIGLTFTRILRSLLRQDPNMVLIGEIRDKDSMDIAFEAALTGHFVMSSLHTNNAFETVQRLRQRDIKPYVIASALHGIMCQRLVARICPACSEEKTPDASLLHQLRRTGIYSSREKPKVWLAKGCAECRMTGTKGRIGVFEILLMSQPLREAVEREASMQQMEQAAPPETYLPMKRYARFLLEQGLARVQDVLDVFSYTPSAEKKAKKSTAR